MLEQPNEYEDARYQHHLKHRGMANHTIFWMIWITIGAIVLGGGIQTASMWWTRRRHRKHQSRKQSQIQSKEHRFAEKATAIVKAAFILPLPHWLGLVLPSFTLGRLVVLVSYIATTSLLLTAVDAPILSEHFLDDLAFRAAWITITQIPLVYFLSTKRGPINVLLGISYERANWMHRLVARMLFLSATTHMAIMKSTISTSDIFRSNEKSMSVVRYGIGAYSALIWIVVTSILPLRRWSHRVFYINHYISTLGFLLVAVQHVPSYARTAIYMAMAFVALDKLLVAVFFVRHNISIKIVRRGLVKFRHGPGRGMLVAGYRIEMVAPSPATLGLPTLARDGSTIIRVLNVPLSWRPGQHVRLYIPAFGPLEMHPFTPANCSVMPPPPLPPRKDIEQRGSVPFLAPPLQRSDMLLTVRAHAGLTGRLANYYSDWLANPCPNASHSEPDLVGFIDGPYGSPPAWEEYENLVLVATSTGVSFILSIMDHLEQLCFVSSPMPRTQNVRLAWILRHTDPHLEGKVDQLLLRYNSMLRESGIILEAEFYTSCPNSEMGPHRNQFDPFAHLRQQNSGRLSARPPLRIRNPEEIYKERDREARMELFVTELYESSQDSFETDEASEMDTLVNRSGDREQEDSPFADAYAVEGQDDAYRPLPSTRTPPPRVSTMEQSNSKACQCALIQHPRRKLESHTAKDNFITRSYGTRPDIARIIAEAAPRSRAERTMVAVCANEGIVRDARQRVAMLNKDFAFGQSDCVVDIFVESMS